MIAAATEAAALVGWFVRRRHRPGWLPWHVSLMCGSYVSFLTAFLVVNWHTPLAWILPTVIGSPLIAMSARRAAYDQVRRRLPAGGIRFAVRRASRADRPPAAVLASRKGGPENHVREST